VIALIVLIHNQAVNLPRLTAAYRGLSEKPDLFVFVCDKCTDSSVCDLKTFSDSIGTPISIIEVHDSDSFAAGKNRDRGLAEAESKLGKCNVVFLDGDCVPNQDLIKLHREAQETNQDFPTVSIGSRHNEAKNASRIIIDTRHSHFKFHDEIFAKDTLRLVTSRSPAFSRMLTWSCNLGLNAKAIELFKTCIFHLSNERRIFHPAFDGSWGGEDDFIGLMASYLGCAVVSLPQGADTVHIWHESRQNNVYERKVKMHHAHLRRLAESVKAPGVSFIECAIERNKQLRASSYTNHDAGSLVKFALSNLCTDESKKLGVDSFSASVVWKWNKDLETRRIDWQLEKEAVSNFNKTTVDARVLKGLSFGWSWPVQTCCLCNSSVFAANGLCKSCSSTPSARALSKFVEECDHGQKIMINALTKGDKLLMAGWSQLRSTSTDMLKNLVSNTVSCIAMQQTLEKILKESDFLEEMHRVMTDYGKAYLILENSFDRTSENLSDSMSKRERLDLFKSPSNWRTYGLDIIEMFKSYGFSVELKQLDFNCMVSNQTTCFVLTKRGAVSIPTAKFLHLEVSSTCNLKCEHCRSHRTIDESVVDQQSYEGIIADFTQSGGTHLIVSNGEPLLKQDELLNTLSCGFSYGLRTSLVTSGSIALSNEFIYKLSKFLSSITISIDSFNADDHDSIRGVEGSFNKAVSLLRQIKSLSLRHPPKVIASCVLTAKNVASYTTYVKKMHELGFDSCTFSVLEPSSAKTMFKPDTFYESQRLKDAEFFMKSTFDANMSGLRTDYDMFDIESLAKSIRLGSNGYAGLCDSSQKNLFVSRDLKVRLCSSKDPIGTWRKEGDLLNLWKSATASLRRLEDSKCSAICGINNCHRKRTPIKENTHV
jgi:MoaA/NifB/PqqE/SkfB family radical SAM enzyme